MKINSTYQLAARETAIYLKKHFGFSSAYLALLLGTGFNDILPFRETARLSFKKVPRFYRLGDLSGHKREFVLGKYKKRQNIIALEGRIHTYESHSNDTLGMVRLQIETLCQLGIKKLITTCAVGRLNPEIPVGSLVIVNDVVTLNAPTCLESEEFVSPHRSLDQTMLEKALTIGEKYYDGEVRAGVHVMLRGPRFESPHDKIILHNNYKADVVGMSLLPELEIAALYGVKTLGICFVTNDDIEIHSHETNLKRGHDKADSLKKFMQELIKVI